MDYNDANIIETLISGRVFQKLAEYTTEALVKKEKQRTSEYEMRRFVATMMLRSRFKMGSKHAWLIMENLAQKHLFKLMERERYDNLETCLRGYSEEGRTGENENEDTWMRRHNLLRRLNDLEIETFENTMKYLFDPNGVYCVDDELESSRAKDVEKKTVSARKTGKDGPVSDCLAEALVGVLLGMRLRASGESQRENVKKLIDTVPPITQALHQPSMKIDRGGSL